MLKKIHVRALHRWPGAGNGGLLALPWGWGQAMDPRVGLDHLGPWLSMAGLWGAGSGPAEASLGQEVMALRLTGILGPWGPDNKLNGDEVVENISNSNRVK